MITNQKGITLIALVITIIVLLILAGVSIAMLTGDNGILTRANESKQASSDAEVLERVNMELNGQLANAMAGKAFDTQTKITSNIGTLPTGYAVTVTPAATTTYAESNTIKITISTKPTDSKITTVEGTVSYDTESKSWKVTAVK